MNQGVSTTKGIRACFQCMTCLGLHNTVKDAAACFASDIPAFAPQYHTPNIGDLMTENNAEYGWTNGPKEWIYEVVPKNLKSHSHFDHLDKFKLIYVVTAFVRSPRRPHEWQCCLATKAIKHDDKEVYRHGYTVYPNHKLYVPVDMARIPASVIEEAKELQERYKEGTLNLL